VTVRPTLALLFILGCIPATETPTPTVSPARVAASAQTPEASADPIALASVRRWDRLSHDDPAVAYARQWLPVFEMMPTGPKSPFPADATDEEIRSFAATAEVLLSAYETLITSVGRLPEGELTDEQVRDAVSALNETDGQRLAGFYRVWRKTLADCAILVWGARASFPEYERRARRVE